ncbi:hypothetical protein ABB37_02195 [Leptomonas pyrrhocoris]|uniref:Uncharacterized protein n=1 Tax=Leptomonas pyrrhocoris TaxID=157538 RepID=A0A0N0DYG3_LEPPY|nr:hypothetical protein ABB37_02195 [Leptomonas pyrrhocoris]KPA84092.1 hypothetical protein ABB37_02195 [Leptomonas pyrrhocoris]|eukprot:XP_015662531.1 hypothetical protein ABB37_02195 [Leptomonas pyrrhocoris]
MENVCVPAQHNLNEVDLLLRELQLRMTNAVLGSPRYTQCLHDPQQLYLALAEFFEEQQQEAQQAAKVALSATDVRRIWTYCFDVVQQHRQQNSGKADDEAGAHKESREELHGFVVRSPAVPLEALQQPAPVVSSKQSRVGEVNENDAPSPPLLHCSLFSLVRPALSSLVELCYIVDCRLQPAPSSSSSSPASTSLSALNFAALTASLIPTRDRVQAVQRTAQLADDLWEAQVSNAVEEETRRWFPFKTMVVFLAGVWWVWSVLDVAHAGALRQLAELLAVEADRPAPGNNASTSLPSSSAYFTVWLQNALRRNGGALHRRLYATPAHDTEDARAGSITNHSTTITEATAELSDEGHEEAGTETEDAVKAADNNFWAQLAS